MSTPSKRRRRDVARNVGIGLFLLLPLGAYALLNVYPSLMSVFYSLTKYTGAGAPEFIGVQNFVSMAKDRVVRIAVVNGFRNMLLVLVVQVPLGFVLAYLLSRVVRGSKVFVFFFFLPVIISEIALALLWRFVYNSQWGLINSLIHAVGVEAVPKWLSNPKLAPWAVLVPGVWQWVGFNVVLFLAAIEGLPQELFDAAKIDGANNWQQLRYVTVPMVRGVYVMATILAINGSMGGPVGYPLMLTDGGGPFDMSQTLSHYIYEQISVRWGGVAHWGYAAALVLLNFALVSVLSGITWRYRRGLEVD